MTRRDTVLVSRTLYKLGVLTLAASIMWVGVAIYSAMGDGLKTSVDPTILAPIDPNLDQEVIGLMTNRLKVVKVEPISISEINIIESDSVPADDTIEEMGQDELAN